MLRCTLSLILGFLILLLRGMVEELFTNFFVIYIKFDSSSLIMEFLIDTFEIYWKQKEKSNNLYVTTCTHVNVILCIKFNSNKRRGHNWVIYGIALFFMTFILFQIFLSSFLHTIYVNKYRSTQCSIFLMIYFMPSLDWKKKWQTIP